MPSWDDPDTVAFFRDRPPDRRLVALVEAGALGCGARVLDVGCAGGRNAAYLTALDFEVVAVDAEPAMVRATRERLAEAIGPDEASRRVRVGRFDRLDFLDTASFDWVVALGALQNAASEAEFHRGVSEIARVLRPAGEALVAHFAPSSRPLGSALRRVPGSAHAYTGFVGDGGRPMVLHEAEELDAAFLAAGMVPVRPSETVIVPSAGNSAPEARPDRPTDGTRVTVNAHYRRIAA